MLVDKNSQGTFGQSEDSTTANKHSQSSHNSNMMTDGNQSQFTNNKNLISLDQKLGVLEE